jgi:phosphatidylglycerol:prolipoprotein diacylglycerol transferase
LGSFTIRWYGLMIACGFLLASWAASKLAPKRNIDVDKLLNTALVVFIGGIIGARLYFVALSWPTFAQHPSEIFQIWLGGLSIHGGIIGGTMCGYFYSRYNKVPFPEGCDIAGACVPLAQSIGRWGNFFNSEAFGRPVGSEFPLKLFIPPESRPAGFLNVDYFQPTFLYESVWDLCIFLILYFVLFDKLKNYPGMTFLTYLLLYSIGRALIEPLRTDSIMVGGMAAPLVVSWLLVFVSAVGMLALYQHYRRKPAA